MSSDIALTGDKICLDDILELSQLFDEADLLPWHVDILNYNTIDTPALLEHIDRVGVVIYRAPE